MRNRWGILGVLFVARATMAFQFQSVAAVAPLLGESFGVNIADIGVLIGLYFAPGIVFALPGGAIGQKFGDKRAVLGALVLMLAGSVLMAYATSWNVQIAARLLTGIGGVILSVQLTKMLTDWFAGKEIATAMAILVNSWPAGIAVSLLTLPMIGTSAGLGAVHLAVAAFIAFGVALLALLYQPPEDAPAPSTAAARLDRGTALAVITAGLIWGPVQYRFRRHLQLRPVDAGRTWLVDRVRRIGDQHCIVACSILRPLRRLPRRSNGTATNHHGRLQPGVCAADDLATPQRYGHRNRRCAWTCWRTAGGANHEPARPRAAARNARDRHGPVLRDVLRLHAAGAGRRRRARKMDRQRCAAFDFGAAMALLCPLLLWGFNRIVAGTTAPRATAST